MRLLSPDRWPEVERLFEAASAHAGASREALLADADPAVADEVRSLLAVEAEAEMYFARPTGLGPILLDGAAFRDEAAPRDDLAVGTRVGPWTIEAELGAGGMGTVYQARRADGMYEQTVALKVLRRGMDSAAVVRRFEQERSVLAALSHPSIARLVSGGTLPDGRPYFVMERVQGEPITAYAERRGLSVRDRLGLFLDVCAAVAHAHRALVVHRDLKPSNVFVADEAGRPAVKLLDFGIAKLLEPRAEAVTLTGDGPRPYTPDRAAPEQVDGGPVTTATDVYALGLLLVDLLAGRRPERGAGSSVLGRGWRPPGEGRASPVEGWGHRRIRGDLDAICRRALRPEPEARFPTVDALAADVRHHLEGRAVSARQGSARYLAATFLRRHRWGVAVAAGAAVLLVGVAGSTALQNRRVAREAEKAQAVASLLEGIMLEADPGGQTGSPPTLREVLDAGVVEVRALDGDPEVKAHLLDVMARVYRALAEYDRALPLQREAVRLLADGGEASPAELAARHHLAYLHEQMGHLDEAERGYRTVLVARRESGDPSGRVESTSDFARLLLRLGRPEDAEALAREGLAVLDEHPAAGPPDLEGALSRADFLSILGRAVAARGDAPGGERLLRASVAIYRREMGPRHTYTALAETRLASVLIQAAAFDEADRLLAAAVDTQTRVWGHGHPWALDALLARADARRAAGRPEQAGPLFREATARAEAAHDSLRADIARRGAAALAGGPQAG